jgi:hypothetical protein
MARYVCRYPRPVFGEKHFSWRCVRRSVVASILCTSLLYLLEKINPDRTHLTALMFDWDETASVTLRELVEVLIYLIPIDYLSLLKTRYILATMTKHRSRLNVVLIAADLVAGLLIMAVIVTTFSVSSELLTVHTIRREDNVWNSFVGLIVFRPTYVLIPPLLASIWLWLYVGSGFLLRAARRFDIGFDWFNRKFDIEKHPLQSIGLISGAIVALMYWAAMGISRVL